MQPALQHDTTSSDSDSDSPPQLVLGSPLQGYTAPPPSPMLIDVDEHEYTVVLKATGNAECLWDAYAVLLRNPALWGPHRRAWSTSDASRRTSYPRMLLHHDPPTQPMLRVTFRCTDPNLERSIRRTLESYADAVELSLVVDCSPIIDLTN